MHRSKVAACDTQSDVLISGQDGALMVVMPVHNAMPYLDAAIESILVQTYADFRLAIYDDASNDGSYERALDWAARDRRIRVDRGEARPGPCGSSNASANLAKTEFVARMDGDDIAMPNRLEMQLQALRDHPEAVLVGSTFNMIDGSGKVIRMATPSRIRGSAPPFAHPSIMYRREVFDAAGGYRAGTEYFEDRDLFERMGRRGTLLVINSPLIGLRFAAQNARLRDDKIEVLERINRQFGEPESGKRHLSPMAFYAVGVLAIQAKQRPVLLGTMLRNVHFRNPVRTIAIMGIIALAELSPKLTRALSLAVFYLRDLVPNRKLRDGGVYQWQFQTGRAGI